MMKKATVINKELTIKDIQDSYPNLLKYIGKLVYPPKIEYAVKYSLYILNEKKGKAPKTSIPTDRANDVRIKVERAIRKDMK
jgi:hypothetical protein